MDWSDLRESACARLCLLTRAAWTPEFPPPLSRSAVRRMLESGALEGLVLRRVSGMNEKLIERARILLSRVQAVHACLEAYEAEGYRLLLPGEADWPEALYVLGPKMPLFLFVRGELALLRRRAVAVAGSRRILMATRKAAACVGEKLAQEGLAMVCGGAAGVDKAAQAACWHAGGSIILVPAQPAAPIMKEKAAQEALAAGRLLLVCDALPDERFSAQKALMRNHVIYSLACAAIVVAAREACGGSWHGAKDCLQGGWRPVFVWDGENADTQGNRALLGEGARPLSMERNLTEQLLDREQINMFA